MSLSFGSGCDGVHEQAETTTGAQTLDTTVREAAGTSQPPQPSRGTGETNLDGAELAAASRYNC